MSEREGSQRERGATTTGGTAPVPGRLAEERAQREGSQRERAQREWEKSAR
jgi:hypothetical protein